MDEGRLSPTVAQARRRGPTSSVLDALSSLSEKQDKAAGNKPTSGKPPCSRPIASLTDWLPLVSQRDLPSNRRRSARDRVYFHVEVDETWLSAKVTPDHRHTDTTQDKLLMVIAGEAIGRVRLARLSNRAEGSCCPWSRTASSLGPSSIRTGTEVSTNSRVTFNTAWT